ncbi:MAG: hypothetical protein IID36_03300, partial [Planctomycetes bacterium]|nr:hypothetical protein [Planctomycetota bacterium]
MRRPVDDWGPITVHRYSIAELSRLLSQCANTTVANVDKKLHRVYFEEYFAHFQQDGKISIVLERSYVDRYFLEDHAAYY